MTPSAIISSCVKSGLSSLKIQQEAGKAAVALS